jgi:hypothetical protein
MMRVPLTIVPQDASACSPRTGEPVTCGVPFPKGHVREAGRLVLELEDGQRVPAQGDVLERWSDGTVRWMLLSSRLTWNGMRATVTLTDADGRDGADGSDPIATCDAEGTVTVRAGAIEAVCESGLVFPFSRLLDAEGRDLIDPAQGGLTVVDDAGRTCRVVIDRVGIAGPAGPQRAVVRWQGHVERDREGHWLELDATGEFRAGVPHVKLAITLRNPNGAAHPGNYWELGDAGSVFVREASLVCAPATGAVHAAEGALDPSATAEPWPVPFVLYQEASGGANWDSPVHVNRDGRVPMQRCGYQLTGGEEDRDGLRATPAVTLRTGATPLSVVVPAFWQNFPRSIACDGRQVRIGFWPAQFPDLHELQGGEQKTHVLFVGAEPAPSWLLAPALLRADADWYSAAGAVPHLAPASGGLYRELVDAAVSGDDTFEAKRERVDEYGWRHFGDVFADHESATQTSGQPLVSHYNNQYDAVAGFATQFFLTGRACWWAQMNELAAHVVDIDIYHAAADKAAYAGGPFWHTCHYMDAGRSTHRAYPKAPGVPGGGPGNEHNYTNGLVLHYLLTGDLRSREAVIGLADWVLRIDDGRLSPFRWFAGGATGLASATREPSYHGPGRGAAHSINTLLDAHRLTSDVRYLEKAEALIRRCIHPADDLDARRLLDVEARWSYTVFLQVLGRYLHDSAERGADDPTAAYAAASLLHYARWMVAHERPYLDTPEQLEFPTETWAAQDMRKCHVLLLASLYTRDPAERARLRARAVSFYDTSLQSLRSSPTRTFTRPVVILLNTGHQMAWFEAHADAVSPVTGLEPRAAGTPGTFVPQRVRAMARARWVAGTIAAAGAAAVVGIWLW